MPHNDIPDQLRHAHGTTGQPPEAGLARDLSEFARQMQAEPDMASALNRIVQAALIEIDAAAWAGITVVEQREVHTEAASAALVSEIDEQQYRLQEGPCLTSLHEQQTVRSDDLRTEPRFPRFAAVAVEHGVRSMLCVQLFVEADNLGALNLYAPDPHAFDEHAESAAMMLAAHAAVAMKGRQVEANLRTALVSRDLIGQAKGILMERYKINDTQAFDMLVMASQSSHRKLREIAEHLATTGELTIDQTPHRHPHHPHH